MVWFPVHDVVVVVMCVCAILQFQICIYGEACIVHVYNTIQYNTELFSNKNSDNHSFAAGVDG